MAGFSDAETTRFRDAVFDMYSDSFETSSCQAGKRVDIFVGVGENSCNSYLCP